MLMMHVAIGKNDPSAVWHLKNVVVFMLSCCQQTFCVTGYCPIRVEFTVKEWWQHFHVIICFWFSCFSHRLCCSFTPVVFGNEKMNHHSQNGHLNGHVKRRSEVIHCLRFILVTCYLASWMQWKIWCLRKMIEALYCVHCLLHQGAHHRLLAKHIVCHVRPLLVIFFWLVNRGLGFWT